MAKRELHMAKGELAKETVCEERQTKLSVQFKIAATASDGGSDGGDPLCSVNARWVVAPRTLAFENATNPFCVPNLGVSATEINSIHATQGVDVILADLKVVSSLSSSSSSAGGRSASFPAVSD